MALLVLMLQMILLFCQIKASSGQYPCVTECGNVTITFPFGIGDQGCYLDKNFEVICNYSSSSGSPKAYLPSINNLELLNVSPYDITVNVPVISLERASKGVNLTGSPFTFSYYYNRFAATGCNESNGHGLLDDYNNLTALGGCLSICTCNPKIFNGCYDILCELSPKIRRVFTADRVYNFSVNISQKCRSVSIVEDAWISSKYMTNPRGLDDPPRHYVPALLEWGERNTWLRGELTGICLEDPTSSSTSTSCLKRTFCDRNEAFSENLSICRNKSCNSQEGCLGTDWSGIS